MYRVSAVYLSATTTSNSIHRNESSTKERTKKYNHTFLFYALLYVGIKLAFG